MSKHLFTWYASFNFSTVWFIGSKLRGIQKLVAGRWKLRNHSRCNIYSFAPSKWKKSEELQNKFKELVATDDAMKDVINFNSKNMEALKI